jgi:hypothetical protein
MTVSYVFYLIFFSAGLPGQTQSFCCPFFIFNNNKSNRKFQEREKSIKENIIIQNIEAITIYNSQLEIVYLNFCIFI